MKIVRFTVFPALALVFVLFVSGCGKRKGKPVSVKEKSGMRTWERIKASGTLRVLKLVSPRGGIPRTVADSDLRESALEGFAAKHHLRLTIIYSERPEKIISTLKNGAGDIAANGISITPYLASTLCETLRLPTAGDSGSKRAVGFVVGKKSGLSAPMNDYLRGFISTYNPNNFTGDLPELKRRRYIKVLTRNNPICYFIHRGGSIGFEYDLAAKFAKEQGLQIIVIVPPKWNDLIPWLKASKGDLIAAAMTLTKKRKAIKGVSFCRTYSPVRQMVVSRSNEKSIHKTADLAGRTFVMRKHSSYWETLSNLRRGGIALKLVAASQTMETDEIIDSVAKGEYDLTLADDPFVKTSAVRKRLSTPLPLGEPRRYAWVVRSSNPLLKKAVNSYITREYRGIFYNVIRKKIFRHPPAGAGKTKAEP